MTDANFEGQINSRLREPNYPKRCVFLMNQDALLALGNHQIHTGMRACVNQPNHSESHEKS